MRTGNPRTDRTHRPPVMLTVAYMASDPKARRPLTPLQSVYLNRVMAHHDQPNRDLLVWACLDCGSIGECESQTARDTNVRVVDYVCCDRATTVLFQTRPI